MVSSPTQGSTQSGPTQQNSGAPAGRARRTHTAAMLPLLKSFNIHDRLSENKRIEERNLKRLQLRVDHIRNPASFPDDASDNESNISFDDDDMVYLRDSDFVQAFQNSFPAYAHTMILKRKAEESRDLAQTRKRHRSGPSTDRIPGVCAPVVYHQLLFDFDRYNALPNFIFLSENLAYINEHALYIPRFKVNPMHGESKAYIMDLQALSSKLTINKDEDMSISVYDECIANRLPFEEMVDLNGPNGRHASWWKSHVAFEQSRSNRQKTFSSWNRVEIALRKEYYNYPLNFSPSYYDQCLRNAILEDTIDEKIKAALARISNNLTPSSSHASRPICIFCMRASAHYSGDAPNTFPDGSELFAVIMGSEAFTPDGERICIKFNLPGWKRAGPCHHAGTNIADVCSLCGSDEHSAVSRKCVD